MGKEGKILEFSVDELSVYRVKKKERERIKYLLTGFSNSKFGKIADLPPFEKDEVTLQGEIREINKLYLLGEYVVDNNDHLEIS